MSPEPTREALEGSDRRQVLQSHRPPEEDDEQACPGLLEHRSFRDPWGLGASDELASQAPCSNRLPRSGLRKKSEPYSAGRDSSLSLGSGR